MFAAWLRRGRHVAATFGHGEATLSGLLAPFFFCRGAFALPLSPLVYVCIVRLASLAFRRRLGIKPGKHGAVALGPPAQVNLAVGKRPYPPGGDKRTPKHGGVALPVAHVSEEPRVAFYAAVTAPGIERPIPKSAQIIEAPRLPESKAKVNVPLRAADTAVDLNKRACLSGCSAIKIGWR